MKDELRSFDQFPKIVPADTESVVTIRPRFDHCRFDGGASYYISYSPINGLSRRGSIPGTNGFPLQIEDGTIRFKLFFEGEQEHVILLDSSKNGSKKRVGDFRIYSLKQDMYRRKPYKGDIHIHSDRSDGKESPGYVAAACRRIGLDFMALTDHRRYNPSLEAQRAFHDVSTDLRIYPGEEIHPPDNPVHIVNFGGKAGVTAAFDKASYREEVRFRAESLENLPPGIDPYQYASCLWCFDKIREYEGLAVFCHPYWFVEKRYDVPLLLASFLQERQPFDALELLGGYRLHETESNLLQVAHYHERRAEGQKIPIVGVSDAHGCECGELFGWYYTIVFAPTPDLKELIAGIRDLYSVAVESLPGFQPRAHGPLRLVKYSHFLIREVFPLHDELNAEEGRLMLDHLSGDSTAATRLAGLCGRTDRLMEHLWADSAKP